jgi:hypothetical protein
MLNDIIEIFRLYKKKIQFLQQTARAKSKRR